jgi:hypothetical protein
VASRWEGSAIARRVYRYRVECFATCAHVQAGTLYPVFDRRSSAVNLTLREASRGTGVIASVVRMGRRRALRHHLLLGDVSQHESSGFPERNVVFSLFHCETLCILFPT